MSLLCYHQTSGPLWRCMYCQKLLLVCAWLTPLWQCVNGYCSGTVCTVAILPVSNRQTPLYCCGKFCTFYTDVTYTRNILLLMSVFELSNVNFVVYFLNCWMFSQNVDYRMSVKVWDKRWITLTSLILLKTNYFDKSCCCAFVNFRQGWCQNHLWFLSPLLQAKVTHQRIWRSTIIHFLYWFKLLETYLWQCCFLVTLLFFH